MTAVNTKIELIVVGKFFVDVNTGEIVDAPYVDGDGVALNKTTPKEKRFYSTSSICPDEATDKAQIEDFIASTVDKRKLKTIDVVDEYKKESDFSLITLKEGSFMSNPQYTLLKKLKDLVLYKNIIIEERSVLAKHLGITVTNLNSKLNTVKDWVVVDKVNVKKGFIKISLNPNIIYRAEHGKIDKLKESSLQLYHAADKEIQHNALYVPFVGPMQPYKEAEWTQGSLTFFENLKERVKTKWENKLKNKEDTELTDVIFGYEQ